MIFTFAEFYKKLLVMESQKPNTPLFNFEKIVDSLIRLGVLYLLLSWCFDILKPFATILIWGSIIAIAVYPAYNYLVGFFRGRKIIASIILTSCLLSLLILPSWAITESLIKGFDVLRQLHTEGEPIIPPPGETTKNWPAITKPIIDIW